MAENIVPQVSSKSQDSPYGCEWWLSTPVEQMSDYKMFNPYQHLTQSYYLTVAQWERIKATLTRFELETIEDGGVVFIGAASVWKGRDSQKDAELLLPHPTNDQPVERSWYVEEYIVEPEDELGW